METLLCTKCGVRKPDEDFYGHPGLPGRRYRSSRCKLCTNDPANRDQDRKRAYGREYVREYQKREQVKVRASQRAFWGRYRTAAIEALGGCCAVCGLDEVAILDIDHVNGGGGDERRSRSRVAILRSIAAGATGYQLLCPNDHRRKTIANGEHRAKQGA